MIVPTVTAAVVERAMPAAPNHMPIEPSEYRKQLRRISQLLNVNASLLSVPSCTDSAEARHDDPDVNTASNQGSRQIGDMLFHTTDTGSCLMCGHENDSHDVSRVRTVERCSRR
jgi:hypothetical protein